NFKNTVIIMTSNLKEEQLRQFMRQEFLNRIDEIVNFSALTESDIRQVVDIQLAKCYDLMKQNDITLQVTEDARRFLANVGYDPEFGARPVKRAIQHHVLNELSKALLSGRIDRSRPIIVDKDGEEERLTFRN
ncbi:MAG: type VI secretion system ATPase TssH, partial [Bacteroidales bacterium]|nr:type VI secretion system ATPase TssH [Bacteroidales bacterium]